MANNFCMVCAVRKGICFEWNDITFVMPFPKVCELVDMIEVLTADGGKEDPDDYTTDLWIGKTMMRYEDTRIPIQVADCNPYINFKGMLMSAIQQYHNMQADENSQEQVDDAMEQIVKNLKL